jgi:hypothetical protein
LIARVHTPITYEGSRGVATSTMYKLHPSNVMLKQSNFDADYSMAGIPSKPLEHTPTILCMNSLATYNKDIQVIKET